MTAPRPPAAPPRGRPAALDLRVLRALPFATVCVVLALAGHLLAGGTAVPPRTVLLGWLLIAAAALAGARRERSLAAITGGLAVAQLGLHVLFHLAQAAPAAAAAPRPPGTSAMPGMPGMPGMDGMPGVPGMPGMAGMASTGASAPAHLALLGLSPAMLAAHLVAVVLAGWWLRRGEAAIWSLVRGGARAASAAAHSWAARPRRLLALCAALREGLGARWRPLRRPDPSGAARPRGPAQALLRHCVIRRGPPGRPAARRPRRLS
ncbi:hypothetical protein OG455_02570 [Kitasatospora sp. NBC_01287]|uniref:hypothetical protein n=1 Tax=Kitasatospora sp. NBC_01287 TaxID=2903573 RepID=UPI00225056C8|nr:hypothetical protein [Kitasatospora sp. NBC_01287]MCX4744410.1 hypothetical protein [Kitasatospora sp. NBC_01287]